MRGSEKYRYMNNNIVRGRERQNCDVDPGELGEWGPAKLCGVHRPGRDSGNLVNPFMRVNN